MVYVMKAEYVNHANMIGWKHRNKRYIFFSQLFYFEYDTYASTPLIYLSTFVEVD
jgi:hypothetical protein